MNCTSCICVHYELYIDSCSRTLILLLVNELYIVYLCPKNLTNNEHLYTYYVLISKWHVAMCRHIKKI